MDTDKKIEYILATVQKGYSQRQIDIDGKGGFFIRLRKGNPPKQVTLDRIYARCLELRTVENTSSNDDSKPQEQITSKDTIQPENNRSNDENVVIQRENQLIPNPIVPTNDPTSLLQTIQDLKKKVAILEKIIARQEKELAKFRSQIGTEKLQITFLDNSIPQQNHMDNSMDNSIPQQNQKINPTLSIPSKKRIDLEQRFEEIIAEKENGMLYREAVTKYNLFRYATLLQRVKKLYGIDFS